MNQESTVALVVGWLQPAGRTDLIANGRQHRFAEREPPPVVQPACSQHCPAALRHCPSAALRHSPSVVLA